jgi:transcriptional regulator of aromatic amino acid metabolism
MKYYNGVLKNEHYIEIDKDELYDLYIVKNWSLTKIAKHYYVSHPTIINRLKEYGIYEKRYKERKNAKSI